jgi:hypothetical protein
MDTIAIRAAAAAVTGSRHQRSSRNGQDAAVALTCPAARTSDDMQLAPGPRAEAAVVVVADGCSSGASSEVGARLGASLFARSLVVRLAAGERVSCPATWSAVRTDVVRTIAGVLERMTGDRAQVLHDHFLFTIVAAAATRDGAAVWALGDGAYSSGDTTRVLGPFADNAPPYLAYDLLGDARAAHFEVAAPTCGAIVIATDGACELDGGLENFAASKFVEHPDALRRHLVVLARTDERIDWAERRVVRTPAALQDDCAIGVLRWRVA